MNVKLLKFVLKTRVTSGYVILIFIFYFLEILYAVLAYFIGKTVKSEFLIAASIIASISLMEILFAGFYYKKSDFDFLFMTPVNRKELAKSFFTTSTLISSSFNFFMCYILLFTEHGYFAFLGLIDIFAILVINISISTIMRKYSTKTRIITIVTLIIWYIIPGFINFPFSPVSAFTGHIYSGTIIGLVLSLLLWLYVYNKSGNLPSTYYNFMAKKSAQIKENVKFSGMSPEKAVFSFNLKMLGGISVMRVGSTARVYAPRFKLTYSFIFSIGIAVVYTILFFYLPKSLYFQFLVGIYYLIYAVIIYPFTKGYAASSTERLWLSLMAMPSYKYFRLNAIGKSLSTEIFLIPLIIGNLILYFIFGHILFLRMLIITMVFGMLFTIIGYYIGGFYNTRQITDLGELSGHARYSIGNIITVIILIPFVLITIISLFIIPVLYIGIIALLIVSFSLILSKKINKRMQDSMVKRDFV